MTDTITITTGLANALVTYLRNGGCRLTGDLLAEQIQIQANAPAAEAARKAEIAAAMEAAKS